MAIPGAPELRERVTPGGRELLALLRCSEGAAADLTPQAWDETLRLALRHGVAPLLRRALQSGGALERVPHDVRARLEAERRATALDNLRNYGQFQRVARALGQQDIPVIALKGLHLAELVYRDISLRPMSDMDILVPRSQVEHSLAILRGLGYGFADDLSGAAAAMLDIKCNISLGHRAMDVLLEVHWSLEEPPGRYAAVVEEIWRRAIPARLGDADALVMPAEFLLLHVCAHLACNHTFAFSLHALCDIAEIIRARPAFDWTVVADHGRRDCWGRGIAAALRLSADHLGAAVPPEVLVSLGADSLDAGMLAEAMEHLLSCTATPGELRTAPNLMAIAGMRGPVKKLAALWSRIFVPRAELSLIYGVPEHSLRLAFYYLVRTMDLLRRYAASAWALSVSDPRLAATAARHARLAKWISGD